MTEPNDDRLSWDVMLEEHFEQLDKAKQERFLSTLTPEQKAQFMKLSAERIKK
jgi:Spy/CpxP family protein refolding chaperone